MGGGDADQQGLGLNQLVEQRLGVRLPGQFLVQPRRRGIHLVQLAAQGQDVEQGVEQGVADLLHQVGRPAVTHEGRAGVAADQGAGEGGRDVGGPGPGLGQVHALVEAAEEDQRRLLARGAAHGLVVGLGAGTAGDGEGAGHPQLIPQEALQAPDIGLGGDHGEAGGGEEVLGDRAPQVPDGPQGGAFFPLDEGLGVETQTLAQGAQETGGALHADGGLQPGFAEFLTEGAPKLPVEADIDLGLRQPRDLVQPCPQGEDQIDLGADPLHQAADLGDVRPGVEAAVAVADEVDQGAISRRGGLRVDR